MLSNAPQLLESSRTSNWKSKGAPFLRESLQESSAVAEEGFDQQFRTTLMAEDWAKTFASNKSPRKLEPIPFDFNDSDIGNKKQPESSLKSQMDSNQSKLIQK